MPGTILNNATFLYDIRAFAKRQKGEDARRASPTALPHCVSGDPGTMPYLIRSRMLT
jgi:hypothetical protein